MKEQKCKSCEKTKWTRFKSEGWQCLRCRRKEESSQRVRKYLMFSR